VHVHSWDRLRIIAALDTVALHLAGEHAFFGWGLPLFLILSVALGVSKLDARGTGSFLSRRTERIVLPWAFWSVVVFGTRVLHAVLHGEPALGWLEWPMALYGPRIHLWFLPFIVALGLAAHLLHRMVGRSKVAPVVAVVLAAALFFVPFRFEVGWPFQQWLFSLAALPLGFALGRAMALEPRIEQLRRLLGIGFVLFVGLALIGYALDARTGIYAFRFAGGLGLLVAATFLPNRSDELTAKLAPLMLGVYVLHPVIYLWVVKPAMCLVVCNHVTWLRVVLAFPVTMGIVWALRRTKLRRVL